MHSIKLEDGTMLENLELNGNNYIANIAIEDSVFEGNLGVIEISDGETTEAYQGMKLMSNIVRDGRSWIVLGQKSQDEIEKETLNNKIAELQQIIDTMLGVE